LADFARVLPTEPGGVYVYVSGDQSELRGAVDDCGTRESTFRIHSQLIRSFVYSGTNTGNGAKTRKIHGLHFDEILFSKLVEDFGGHPFLIRQFCSEINKACKGDRPEQVDRALYNSVMSKFRRVAIDYLSMIVSVLHEWYPEEYEMLRFLAHGDHTSFAAFADDHALYTKHLIGYGLVTQSDHGFSFNIEALREYLNNLHKYERLNLSDDEKTAEISARRNRIGKLLRVTIRNSLHSACGRKKAGECVLAAITNKRRKSVGTADIDVLLSRDSSPLFFLELIAVIKRERPAFQNVFEMEKNKL